MILMGRLLFWFMGWDDLVFFVVDKLVGGKKGGEGHSFIGVRFGFLGGGADFDDFVEFWG